MLHFYLRTTPADEVKLIISVSKKVSKSAVVRNKIRRRVRPIAKKFTPRLKPANYFLVAKPGAQDIKGVELEKQIEKIISPIIN